MLEFGNLIREARERGYKRGSDVAGKVGLSTSALSDFELGKKQNPPTPEVMAKLSTELGLSERRMLRAIGYLSTEEVPPSESFDALDVIDQKMFRLYSQLEDSAKAQTLEYVAFVLDFQQRFPKPPADAEIMAAFARITAFGQTALIADPEAMAEAAVMIGLQVVVDTDARSVRLGYNDLFRWCLG